MGLSGKERRQVAQLVESLDHPDAVHQREVMDALVSMGSDVLDPVAASLSLVSPRVKTSLVRVMGELGDRRALLPLMRFVFDHADEPSASDARALAMKAIAHLAGPEDAKRVFAFLLDVYQDPDPFVRGYAFAAMGQFGDKRAVPILQSALQSEDDFVREQASSALARLERADGDALESDVDDIELLRQLRGARGGEREYWTNELLSRDSAFEMVKDLVEDGGPGARLGLQLLQRIDDPRVRGVALRKAQSTPDPDQLAIALRILASQIEGDATEDELSQAKLALYSEDRFVRLAALGVAGASGDRELMRRAAASAGDSDPVVAATAAEALARGTTDSDRRLLPELIDAARSSFRSPEGESEEAVRTRAYLMRAMRNLVSSGGFGVGDAQRLALDLLAVEDARPIVVTGLELLDVTTRNGGGEVAVDRVVPLAEYLGHDDPSIRRRAFEVLERAAPEGADILLDALERRLYDADPGEAERVLRVVERVASRRARLLVERVAEESSGEIQIAAEAAMRRMRSGEEYIDATFESASDSNDARAEGVAETRSDEPSESAETGPDDPRTDWGDDTW